MSFMAYPSVKYCSTVIIKVTLIMKNTEQILLPWNSDKFALLNIKNVFFFLAFKNIILTPIVYVSKKCFGNYESLVLNMREHY